MQKPSEGTLSFGMNIFNGSSVEQINWDGTMEEYKSITNWNNLGKSLKIICSDGTIEL